MAAMNDEQIRQIVTDYDNAKAMALEMLLQQRDERLREALASGRTQAEIIRATGMSREAVRLALNPEARATARAVAAARKGVGAAREEITAFGEAAKTLSTALEPLLRAAERGDLTEG